MYLIRCFLVLSFFLSMQVSYAQDAGFFSIGLRSNITGLKNLNHIITHYNDTRSSWLSKDLSTQSQMAGLEIGIEKSTGKFGMSFLKLYYTQNKSSGGGTSNGTEYSRKIKTTSFGTELFDFWYTPLKISKLSIGGGAMPIGLGMFRIKTKLNDESWTKVPLSNLEESGEKGLLSTYHAFSNIHLDVISNHLPKTIHFQIFYSLNWFQDEYTLFYLNRTINPTSYPTLLKSVQLKNSYLGLKLSVIL